MQEKLLVERLACDGQGGRHQCSQEINDLAANAQGVDGARVKIVVTPGDLVVGGVVGIQICL